jgi:hypothetical protein
MRPVGPDWEFKLDIPQAYMPILSDVYEKYVKMG